MRWFAQYSGQGGGSGAYSSGATPATYDLRTIAPRGVDSAAWEAYHTAKIPGTDDYIYTEETGRELIPRLHIAISVLLPYAGYNSNPGQASAHRLFDGPDLTEVHDIVPVDENAGGFVAVVCGGDFPEIIPYSDISGEDYSPYYEQFKQMFARVFASPVGGYRFHFGPVRAGGRRVVQLRRPGWAQVIRSGGAGDGEAHSYALDLPRARGGNNLYLPSVSTIDTGPGAIVYGENRRECAVYRRSPALVAPDMHLVNDGAPLGAFCYGQTMSAGNYNSLWRSQVNWLYYGAFGREIPFDYPERWAGEIANQFVTGAGYQAYGVQFTVAAPVPRAVIDALDLAGYTIRMEVPTT